MKGEFTRNTFRRSRHFSGVRLQQGRVHLDADFNEQVDIGHHRDVVTSGDVIGRNGAPDEGGGFALSAAARLNAADVVGSIGRVVGSRGTVLATGDGGATWTAHTLPSAAAAKDLLAVDVIDATHAFAVGAEGTILAHDGTNWTVVAAPAAAGRALRGVHFPGTSQGWLVGDGGLVLGTADGGATWTAPTVPGGATETLRSVHFASATRGWAVGDAGRILATADAGATWTIQTPPSGFTARLHSVRFATAQRGWAVGDGSAILTTGDGGATWTAQQPPAGVAATLRAVEAESASIAWAVGDGGVLLHTTNGGATWTAVAVDAPLGASDLLAVRSLGGGTALLAGDLSALARVTPASGGASFQIVQPSVQGRDLAISAGRIYVGGVLCENERPVRYLAQPDLPSAAVPTAAGNRIAYLEVWTRHLTALERTELREVALAGPDTATRTQTVWQVKLDDTLQPANPECAAIPKDWAPAIPGPPAGRLRARSAPAALALTDCMVPAGGGYRRLENQLYRVEVHDAGAAGTATFKWSRGNGAVAARLVATDPAATARTVTLGEPARDAVGGFAGAALVELTDERRVLAGEPGVLLAVQGVTGKVVKLVNAPPAMSAFGSGAIVRRWDGKDTVDVGWKALGTEEGVEVQFGAGQYRTGDYWTIPARTLTGDVEWPRQDGAATFMPPEGIERRYCPLALVEVAANGGLRVLGDCRPLFTPLVAQTHLHMAGGDGQEIMPPPGGGLAPLPEPLEVVVVNGRRPVTGARVRFSVVDNQDRVGGATSQTVVTGAGGVASCPWSLSTLAASHRVRVELLDAGGTAVEPPLHFVAGFSVAAEVAYDPSTASDMAGTFTVQAAIDRLSRRTGGVCTVNVRPGDDLQAAVEALPASGGELCLAAGVFKLTDPLHVTKRHRVTITGRGPSTVLRCGHEVCVVLKSCAGVEVSNLRVEAGGMGTAPGEEHLMGALTFFDCADILVRDCELACPDATGGRGQACLTVHGPGRGALLERTRIEGNRLEVGEGQVGMLIVNPRLAQVSGNHIGPAWSIRHPLTHVPPPNPNPLAASSFDPRAIGQGIAVGGDAIGVADIRDNVVERAVQGIHVGTSRADGNQGAAGAVRLSGNVVLSMIADDYERERHAIFVGNTMSLSIADTTAVCVRTGGERARPTPVDAIRLVGRFGHYVHVRNSSLHGYTNGVRLEARPDPGDVSSTRLWYVGETMCTGGSSAVIATSGTHQPYNVVTS